MSKKIEMPLRSVLYSMYNDMGESLAVIAVRFNTSPMTVLSWMRKYKIPTKCSKKTVYHELRETSFSKHQVDLVVGSVLGDGSLRIPKHGKNAMFSEKHCEKQKGYIEWKQGLLKPFVKSKLYVEKGGSHIISGKRCNVQDSYSFRSVSHPMLTEIYNIFYTRNGSKVIPLDLYDYLNDFVVAVWFMDDGSLVWKPRYYRFDLHTEGFSYYDNVTIREVLIRYFNFEGNVLIIPRNYSGGVRYYISLRGKEELRKVLSRLCGHVPNVMRYKFNTCL